MLEHPHPAARTGRDVVPGPQPPKPLAAGRQLPDQLDEAGVVHLGADLRAQASHRVGRDRRQGRVERRHARVQEDRAQQVHPGGEDRRQRGRGGVGEQHVQVSTVHEGGRLGPRTDQLPDAHRHPLRAACRPAGRHRPGQAVQVRRGVRVQPQRAGQRLDHLRRRVPVTPLLQPQVVVGADAGEQCRPPRAAGRAPADGRARAGRRPRPDQLAPGTQVLAQRAGRAHPPIVGAAPTAQPGPATPRKNRDPASAAAGVTVSG